MKMLNALRVLVAMALVCRASAVSSNEREIVAGMEHGMEQFHSKNNNIPGSESRQSGYGLVKFEGQTTSEELNGQNKYGLVTFESQKDQPLKFENQADESVYSNDSLYPQNNAIRDQETYQDDNYQQNVQPVVQSPQKKRKKRRRRKPRVQQFSQAYPGQNSYGNFGNPENPGSTGYPGNSGYSGYPVNSEYPGRPYRNPRRPRPSSTLSSVLEALTSVTVNDDHQCLPMLVCQAAARGIFGESSFLQFSQLNSLIATYGAISSSPILVFGRAAILGMTAKDDPDSCAPKYPLCPSDPQALVHYLNNHKGGFFRFFRSPDIGQIYNQILPGQAGQYGHLNIPNGQLASQLQNVQAQNYGLHQPSVNGNYLQYAQNPEQQYGLYPNNLYQPLSPTDFQGHGFRKYPQNIAPNYPYYGKSKEIFLDVENSIDNEETKEMENRGDQNSFKRFTNMKNAGKKRKSEVNSGHVKSKQRYRRSVQQQPVVSAQQNPWFQYPESPAPRATFPALTDSQSVTPSVNEATTPFETDALEYVVQKDDHHCFLLLLCEQAARGLLNVGKVGSDMYNNFRKLLPDLKQVGQAVSYGLNVTGDTDACPRRYPQCPTDQQNLVSYMKNYKGGFEKFFNKKNYDEFHKSVLEDQLRSQTEEPSSLNYFPNIQQKPPPPQFNRGNAQLSAFRQNYGPNQQNYNSYQFNPSSALQSYNGYQNFYSSSGPQYAGPYRKAQPYPSSNIGFQGQGLYSRDVVNYGHIYPIYTRRLLVNTDIPVTLNQDMNKIQKRIQNHISDKDYIDSPHHASEWRFPDIDINKYYALHGTHLKFPIEKTTRDAKGFSFPGAQSNRQYSNNYDDHLIENDDFKFDDNGINGNSEGIDMGVEVIYIVRGNGDPKYPEVIRLRPGEKFM